jgi:alkylation response protein AidB-like acyl-CoA dehydrogenase
VAGTDAAVKNCQMALEIMGQAGIRHDRGAEKIFRDSKLLQIYEGTNQLNRLNVFKRLISKSVNNAEVFSASNV